MKLLIVSKLDRSARAINTITKYIRVGKELGHEVALFSEPLADFADVPTSLSVKAFDFVLFVVYDAKDFPDLPYLARLLDGVPKERRAIIDCCGRFNDTIRIEHDFNHLEKLDGHQGWEWIEGFEAVADKILQPTYKPLRTDVRSFLFHGFDPASAPRQHATKELAVKSWLGTGDHKPYGMTYVGNNWQRWYQMESVLKALEPIQDKFGPICLTGWDWARRPDWAIQLGLHGADVDEALIKRLNVQTKDAIPATEVTDLVSQGRFSPVIHRPLFNQLGLVTNRTFATFYADTIPLLLLPADTVRAVYGADALPLAPTGDLTGWFKDAMARPEYYWDAVLKTRNYLSEHHSYQRRFKELLAILQG
jgi:hypothetical protein